MKNTWPPHVLGGAKDGFFDESIMVKMEFEVTMGLYRKGACLIK